MKKLFILSLLVLSFIGFYGLHSYAEENAINFSTDEFNFISNHPVIYIGVDPKFVPFEFIDQDGNYQGIAAEYLALISERTTIRFEVVADLTWEEAFDKALNGEIDALPAIGKTSEREQHFLFSEPYYYFKRVLVTRADDKAISGMEDLAGLTVAVQKNSSHHSYLLDYPNIYLSLYNSVDAALAAVASGSERAFIGNLATSHYIIRSHGIPNLRLISFEAEKQQALYFACRKDYPELISIFNKALKTISESEKQAINKKWIDLNTELDYGPFVRVLLIVGSLIAVVLGVSFFWNVRLSKEIAKRKIIQKDLEIAKQEAEAANEFKSRFMARMSHEIRTPLNAITGMSYLLKKTSLTLTQRMYIDRITQVSSNMLNIINDILDYSKIEANKVVLENISFSMDQIIQDVVNIVSYKIEEQEITFKLTKDPLIPNWFFGDAKRITQVLLNVVNNAAKFTNKGEVALNIRLLAKEGDHYHLSFTVKDTGIGMSEEQIQKLFKPFTQGDSSITRRFGGSGLGLSIVKNLVDLLGGEIQVYSTPGEGSTFIINFTLTVDKEKETVYRKSIAKEHFQNLRTLVFDKKTANINLIESYLSAFGLYCEGTTSEESALNMLVDGNIKAKPIDLFIIDYESPMEGGFTFIQTLKNNPDLKKMPKIIMVLPMSREDLFDKLNDYNIDIGIGKPIIPSILLNGILDLLKLKEDGKIQTSLEERLISPITDQPYRVLVVEDNRTNQLIAKSLLTQIGIESILADNGKEAVDLFPKYYNDVALILMDLHMPVMDGYQAAELIHKIAPNVPIVAMTADVVLGVKEKCEQKGIHYFIGKPFDPDQFLLTVKTILLSTSKEKAGNKALDSEQGIKNIGGNAEVYHQVLNEYYQENTETLTKLKKAIEEKRFACAVQIIHKVKSSSGSIGAKAVYELSVKFQKIIESKDESKIQEYQKTFTDLFENLLEEIKIELSSQ